MNRNLQCFAAALPVAAAALLLLGRGAAGDDKGPWQPILPKEIYKELAKREAEVVRDRLKEKPDVLSLSRAKFGAVLIAALSMSVKDGVAAEELRGSREISLRLAKALDSKDQLAVAQKLAATLPDGKPDPTKKMDKINWGSYLKIADLMDPYQVQKKGGDGMHPDLQSNIRLKGALNGLEEKIHALAKTKLTDDNMKKEAKELELLGYRSAVIAELAWYYVPAGTKDKKDPKEWRPLAVQMRDHSLALAVAARQGDAGAVHKSSGNLDSTCMQCHTIFKH